MADGPKQEEALKNAGTVSGEWIETARALGRKVPEPQGKLKAG
jgi:predicted RNase H-like HicB family nuclease